LTRSSVTELLYHLDPLGYTDTPVAQIGADQAIEEVELLFAVIKYGYAGYQFFGGDEAFGAARDRILSGVGRNTGSMATGELLNLIMDGLHFVQDGHFAVGGATPCKTFLLYADFSHEFVRNHKGEFVAADGRALIGAGGGSPPEYMKASISEAGDIVYVPGLLAPNDTQSISITLEFGDGGRQSVRLSPVCAEIPATPGLPYKLSNLEGTPLAVCRLLGPVGDSAESLDAFVRDAERLWYESVVILDLRSNPGGDSMLARQWCLHLTLKNPQPPGASAELRTATAVTLRDNMRRLSGIGPGDGRWRSPLDPNNPGWSAISLSTEAFATSKPLLVVLIDSYSASGTEHFVDSLRHMDNVVFIGTNTRGAYLTGNIGSFVLPHSRLRVSVPTQLQVVANAPNMDGMGFLPDFWVAPECILDRTARFVRRHLVSSFRPESSSEIP